MSLRQWLIDQKSPDYNWLLGYLNKRGFRLESSSGRSAEAVLEWIKQNPSHAFDRDLMRDLRGAWAQRQYRKGENRTTCNLVLSRKAKGQLRDLAKGRGASLGETVESLLAERKGKIPPPIAAAPEPPLPSPTAAGSDLISDHYPRVLEEMLLDALTDAAILKLQLDELRQKGIEPPSTSIPGAIKTAKDLLTASAKESSLEGFLNIKRSLGQRKLRIDEARVERRLTKNADPARVIRPQSISRRLAATHIPIPTADLNDLHNASHILATVADKSWPSSGATLVITGANDASSKWLASAISRYHCEAGVSVRYMETLEITSKLDGAKGIHIEQLIGRINDTCELLVIDGWDSIDWTHSRLEIMNLLLKRREHSGATIIVSSRSIRSWAASIAPLNLSRELAMRLGTESQHLLARPGYVYNPQNAVEHPAKLENGVPVALTNHQAQIHAIIRYEQIVMTPWRPEARRLPAITLDLSERDSSNNPDGESSDPLEASLQTLSSNSESEINIAPSAGRPNDTYIKVESPAEVDQTSKVQDMKPSSPE